MVDMWRGTVVFGAIASIAMSPSGAGAEEDCAGGAVRCGDGSCAGADLVCDGTLDCADGADEALELCRGSGSKKLKLSKTLLPESEEEVPTSWRPLFALILLCQQPWTPLHDALCPEVCREWPKYCYYAISAEHGAPGTCVLPQPSKRGAYSIVDVEPRGRGPADFSLAFACPRGYRLQGEQPRCLHGTWTSDFPTCIAMFPAASVATAKPTADPILSNSCALPESPENGYYVWVRMGTMVSSPGRVMAGTTLTVQCNPGYMAFDRSSYCISGNWVPEALPNCTRFCTLPTNTGTTYICLVVVDDATEHRQCPEVVPSGTVVVPQCNQHYYSGGDLPNMRCLDRSWDNIAICRQECGLLAPAGEPLVIGGQASVHSRIPWHAVVYDKSSAPYRQVCGGSLVSTRVVISAAHCFWSWADDLLRPAEDYVVATGKAYRSWGGALPRGTQTSVQSSDVKELKTPTSFMGISPFFRNDISLVILATPVVFDTFVQPVCLDFHPEFETRQLRSGNIGKILSWASEDEDQPASDILGLRSLPYVDHETCLANSSASFRKYITLDKFCAGSQQGTGLCVGDSGGGLSFPANNRGKRRYYLRGIASVAPLTPQTTRELECSRNSFIAFTRLLYHENFIKKYMRS